MDSQRRMSLVGVEQTKGLREAFLGDGKHLSDEFGVFGVAQCGEAEQGTNGAESRVAGSRCVVTLGFQVVEEGADDTGAEILDAERGRRLAGLAPDETTGSLQAKLTPVGVELLFETLERLKEGSVTPQEQNESDVTLAPMIKKEDGLIDWNQPAEAIERRVRGFNPWPSAYTQLRGMLLKVHRAKIVEPTRSSVPGEIVRADVNGFWVATASGVLSLEEVQLENKKRLRGVEFVKGARIEIGDRL